MSPSSAFSPGDGHPADRLIVALDGMGPDQALALARAVPDLRWVKVGLELFTAAGPEVMKVCETDGLTRLPLLYVVYY